MDVCAGSDVVEAMLADAFARDPREACGLVLGRVDAAGCHALAYRPCPNLAAHPERGFRLDPRDLLAAEDGARSRGLSIVGTFHSHPSGDPLPSPLDHAHRPHFGTLWIGAIRPACPRVRAYVDAPGRPLTAARLRIVEAAVPHRDR